ncbi:hypothetical protein BOTBODRAFT_49538 [Botryobasidium botryosum FD-172 SS1]|uniref:Uncharacterized protein n=1 Tax=Botryobasidium botryosum (strain FD-172 SS1) TaxID=930990 RepID=A0A067LV41_BOTB1|nr:hypothetical protein BOTBODRAFT_49538 [Botryobasidium botryosum FD-172 SS1]
MSMPFPDHPPDHPPDPLPASLPQEGLSALSGDPADDHSVGEAESSAPSTKTPTKSLSKAGRWTPWEDRMLIKVIHHEQPFLYKKPDQEDHWESVRRDMETAHSNRSAKNMRSLQKTGTEEEVSSFMELLEDLSSLEGEIDSNQAIKKAVKLRHEEDNKKERHRDHHIRRDCRLQSNTQEKYEEDLWDLCARREQEAQCADALTDSIKAMAQVIKEQTKQQGRDREEHLQMVQALGAQQATTGSILSNITDILKDLKSS